MAELLDRHKFLRSCGALAVGSLLLLVGCSNGNDSAARSSEEEKTTAPDDNNPSDCNDLRDVSESELDKRKKLGYVKEAPSPDVRCEVCKLYLPADAGKQCGGCSLFKGPVAAVASCTYFAPLSEEER